MENKDVALVHDVIDALNETDEWDRIVVEDPEIQKATFQRRFEQTNRAKELLKAIDDAISRIGMTGDYHLSYYENDGSYSLVADFQEKSSLGRKNR